MRQRVDSGALPPRVPTLATVGQAPSVLHSTSRRSLCVCVFAQPFPSHTHHNATMATTDPRSTWGLAGQLTTAAIAALTALWVLSRNVLRPLADNAWLATMRRRRNDVNAFLREDVFKGELTAGIERDRKLDRILLMSETTARVVDKLAERQDEIVGELGRQGGVLDQMQRETVARSVGLLEPPRQ